MKNRLNSQKIFNLDKNVKSKMTCDMQLGWNIFRDFLVTDRILTVVAEYTVDGKSFESRKYHLGHIYIEKKTKLDLFLKKYAEKLTDFTVSRDEKDIFLDNERSLSEILVNLLIAEWIFNPLVYTGRKMAVWKYVTDLNSREFHRKGMKFEIFS